MPLHPKAQLGIGRPDLAALANAALEYGDAYSAFMNAGSDWSPRELQEAEDEKDRLAEALRDAALVYWRENA